MNPALLYRRHVRCLFVSHLSVCLRFGALPLNSESGRITYRAAPKERGLRLIIDEMHQCLIRLKAVTRRTRYDKLGLLSRFAILALTVSQFRARQTAICV